MYDAVKTVELYTQRDTLSRNGLSLGVSTGAWYGSRFDSIDEGLEDFGIVPQFTAGTSFLF